VQTKPISILLVGFVLHKDAVIGKNTNERSF